MNVVENYILVLGFYKVKVFRDCDCFFRDRGRKEKGGVVEGGREKVVW